MASAPCSEKILTHFLRPRENGRIERSARLLSIGISPLDVKFCLTFATFTGLGIRQIVYKLYVCVGIRRGGRRKKKIT